MHSVQFTLKSANSKVGPMPVTTSDSATCPDACPLKANGCYASYGPLGMMWSALSKAKPGEAFKRGKNTLQSLTWQGLCDKITALPKGTLWRHNQAGDLPGHNNTIDTEALSALVDANAGKRGFTYTHKPMDNASNRDAVAQANAKGFTINLSANNLSEADKLADLQIAPVAVVLPDTIKGNQKLATPQGKRVVVCPATYRDNVSCKSCQLCQRKDRKVIVGFPAHGAGSRKASAIAAS